MSNFAVLAHKLGVTGCFFGRVFRRCAFAGLSAFLAICLASVSPEAFAQVEKHDIAGVKVGMSLAATKDAIAKVNPKYVISEIKGTKGNVIALQAIVGFDYNNTDDEFLAVLKDDGTTWFIGRWQAPAEPILLETLNDALEKKYGAPSRRDSASFRSWFFDRQGKQVSYENCGRQSAADNYAIGGLNTRLYPPKTFSSVCGGVIAAAMTIDTRRLNNQPVHTVTRFYVQIAEVKSQYDEAAGRSEAAAREKKLREEKEREELLKKAKPPTL